MEVDPDKLLAETCENAKVLYYPSCGEKRVSAVLQLDYDVYVLSDFNPTTKATRSAFWQSIRREWSAGIPVSLHKATVRTRIFRWGRRFGFLFFQDNNEVLARIKRAGGRLACFVGIRDGCAEGGNYECVNEPPFLTKVLDISQGSMKYYLDHSLALKDPEETKHCNHIFYQRNATLPDSASAIHDFALKNLLVRAYDKWQVYHRSPNWLFRGLGERKVVPNHPLWKLLPFRERGGSGIIADYTVTRRGQQLEPGEIQPIERK